MPLKEWNPGDNLPSPVYLDASILASTFVAKDKRYKPASQILADLLIQQTEIVISVLTISETLWALAKMSYHEIQNQPFHQNFHPGLFEKHAHSIFEKYGKRMRSVADWLKDYRDAGISIAVYPASMESLEQMVAQAPDKMQNFKLASTDAMHLAAAEARAKCLVTGDDDFKRADKSPLDIYYIPKPTN